MIEYNRETKQLSLRGYSKAKNGKFSEKEKRDTYLAEAINIAGVSESAKGQITSYFLNEYRKEPEVCKVAATNLLAGKKYKPVALKVKPVYTELRDNFRIRREIRGDPLENMPQLNPCPPDFEPTGRYTQERKDALNLVHQGDFLWPEERKLMHHLMMEQNQAFAWDDTERGRFRVLLIDG